MFVKLHFTEAGYFFPPKLGFQPCTVSICCNLNSVEIRLFSIWWEFESIKMVGNMIEMVT